uniref:Uncharacterized protein n=1 Tax=Zea mays TaxID=4577 RepID=B6TKF8_MAIZE|nr:hypothetical protein [Zea mays]
MVGSGLLLPLRYVLALSSSRRPGLHPSSPRSDEDPPRAPLDNRRCLPRRGLRPSTSSGPAASSSLLPCWLSISLSCSALIPPMQRLHGCGQRPMLASCTWSTSVHATPCFSSVRTSSMTVVYVVEARHHSDVLGSSDHYRRPRCCCRHRDSCTACSTKYPSQVDITYNLSCPGQCIV